MATETLENVESRTAGAAGPEGGAVSTARGPGRLVEFLGEVRAEL